MLKREEEGGRKKKEPSGEHNTITLNVRHGNSIRFVFLHSKPIVQFNFNNVCVIKENLN